MSRLRQLSIRWRLALTSAGLTLAILLAFAVVMGVFTARQLHASFDDEVRSTAADLQERIRVEREPFGGGGRIVGSKDLVQVAAAGGGALRVVDPAGRVLAQTTGAPKLDPPREGMKNDRGFRVVVRPVLGGDSRGGPGSQAIAFVQYAKPLESVDEDVARVKLFLGLGVIGGTALALLAGLAVARRAMTPIAELTSAAQGVARTRDPDVELPMPEADDEIADLARTLDDMLGSLGESRAEAELALSRQREFVAD
ncbi:MAG: HAMP domain-containing protein, partial [Thermoleophilaceae bacterium]|nr:HAMP domain-containing protein [Thermoleophilaceae bacterium]